jgi:opacity protein-like surface antigen
MFKKATLAAVAVVGIAALSAPVAAADLVIDEPIIDEPVISASGFDWEGAYIGVFGGYNFDFAAAQIGGELGYNFLASENFLLGVEASGLFYLDGSNDHELFLRGKAGFVADQVAIYALAGVGEYDFTTPLYDIGAGVEFAVADNITLNAEVFGRNQWGAAPTVLNVEAGLRFHF